MSEKYLEWAEFKQRLSPPPNRRTGRKWVEEGNVLGNVVDVPGGYLVYIDVQAWEAGVRAPEPIDAEIEAMLG